MYGYTRYYILSISPEEYTLIIDLREDLTYNAHTLHQL